MQGTRVNLRVHVQVDIRVGGGTLNAKGIARDAKCRDPGRSVAFPESFARILAYAGFQPAFAASATETSGVVLATEGRAENRSTRAASLVYRSRPCTIR